MADIACTSPPRRIDEWDVRVHWRAMPGASCPACSTYAVNGESQAIDAAVGALDGGAHPWLPVRAVRAEIRRTGATGPWRSVADAASYV